MLLWAAGIQPELIASLAEFTVYWPGCEFAEEPDRTIRVAAAFTTTSIHQSLVKSSALSILRSRVIRYAHALLDLPAASLPHPRQLMSAFYSHDSMPRTDQLVPDISRQVWAHSRQAATQSSMSPTCSQLSAHASQISAQSAHT
jgi:hypothetical protein